MKYSAAKQSKANSPNIFPIYVACSSQCHALTELTRKKNSNFHLFFYFFCSFVLFSSDRLFIECERTCRFAFDVNIWSVFLCCPNCALVKWFRFYNLTIRATNMASVSATSSAIIHILDRNDNAPYFTQQLYKGEISESAPIASLILAINDTLKMDQRYVPHTRTHVKQHQQNLQHFDIKDHVCCTIIICTQQFNAWASFVHRIYKCPIALWIDNTWHGHETLYAELCALFKFWTAI